jgi:S-formylglutathione hydrolase
LLNHLLVEFPCVALIGFGSGGQGAIRFALKDPKRFPIAVGLNADLDHFEKIGQGSSLDRLYASKESCRQDSAVLQVHPSNHPAYLFFGVESPRHPSHRGNDRLHEKLNALGVSHEFAITPLPELWQAALRFLQSALEQESRRLV